MFRHGSIRRLKSCHRLEWESIISGKCKHMPEKGSKYFKTLGSQIVKDNAFKDAGKSSFEDCLRARSQLESILHAMGYKLDVLFFGGIVSLGFFEVSGDLDMAAVGEIEPSHEEAALVVQSVSKELRRMGLRPMAIPRAFIPILRCDRTVNTQPAQTSSEGSRTCSFIFRRPLSSMECDSFFDRLRGRYGSTVQIRWMKNLQSATVTFETTLNATHAMAHIQDHCSVELNMRQPSDSRDGPELYRYPFDLCFNSMGVQNTFMLRKILLSYPGARHLLLALRRWGKRCHNIHSTEGFLATYCYTVMLAHFLMQTGRVQPIDPEMDFVEPLLLPKEPKYVPLRQKDVDPEDLGYLYYHFINYYAHVFDFDTGVINVTTKNMRKEDLGWNTPKNQKEEKPPFFSLAIKDPLGNENCARIVDKRRTNIIHQNFLLASHILDTESRDPIFALRHLEQDAPRIEKEEPLHSLIKAEQIRIDLIKKRIAESSQSKEQFGKRYVADAQRKVIAGALTNSVLLWMKKQESFVN
ncbi:RNA polymerase I [Perkinsela sp. CCAP 1560/4]|nr:RNA polymerase I [Perkinsela sp. CCAP 1560/4]|eukprot:KNH09464.1 RNA polymerase I [Perkinsela sp. CCAP 1560/4]